MRLIYYLALFAVALVVQSGIVPLLLPARFLPAVDLPLLVAIHMAVARGKSSGMFSGLVLGYAQDALAGGALGINGFAKISAGYVGGLLREKLFMRKAGHRLGACFGAVVAGVAAKLAVLNLFSQPSPGVFSGSTVLAVAAGTMLALPLTTALGGLEVRIGVRSADELSFED